MKASARGPKVVSKASFVVGKSVDRVVPVMYTLPEASSAMDEAVSPEVPPKKVEKTRFPVGVNLAFTKATAVVEGATETIVISVTPSSTGTHASGVVGK